MFEPKFPRGSCSAPTARTTLQREHLFDTPKSLWLLTRALESSRRVRLARDTETDAEFLSRAGNNGCGERSKESRYEESCSRGAILKVAEFRDPRVNRKRREREFSAFSLLPPVPQRL